MNNNRRILLTIVIILVAVLSACASRGGTATTSEEESGAMLSLDETYDKVRNGARLVLTYDAQSNSFNGFVENTTNKTLQQARVEVHLSNGVELGPTTPIDLGPGEKVEASLAATTKWFDGWTAHVEVEGIGSGKHGQGRESNHDEGSEGKHNESGSN